MIIVYLLVLVTGFYALVKGADMFVDGSSNIARMLHVPGLIIGLTIVAFGTSAPELAVSTSAALQGANEIAVSNVVGSNLFNLLVVLGICAVLKPIAVDRDVLRRDYPVSLGITGLALAITCGSAFVINRGPQYMLAQGTSLLSTGERFLGIDMSQIVGTVSRIDGLVLVIMLVLYIGLLIISSLRGAAKEEEPQEAKMKSYDTLIVGSGLYGAEGGRRASDRSGPDHHWRAGCCQQCQSHRAGAGHDRDPDRSDHCRFRNIPSGAGHIDRCFPQRGGQYGRR